VNWPSIQARFLLTVASVSFGMWHHSWMAGLFLATLLLVSAQTLSAIIQEEKS
jgi:hypothetical protein